jgi:tetratricopeptide (TPR) repeat protein
MTLRKKLLFLIPLFLTVLIVPLSLYKSGRPIGELIADVAEKTRLETTIPRLDYLFTQFRVIVTYLRLLVFPVNQNLDYDYPIYHSFFAPPVFLSFLLLLALLGFAVWLWRKASMTWDQGPGTWKSDSNSSTHPFSNIQVSGLSDPFGGSRSPVPEFRLAAFGILWFFITLSVESSVIPIADVIFEHRLYLPSVGAFIALAAAALFLCRFVSPRKVAFAAGIIVLFLTAATFARNRDTARKSPQKARVRYNLALALMNREQFREAFSEAEAAARLDPAAPKPHNLLGMLYYKQDIFDRAITELAESARLDPAFAEPRTNLGDVYRRKGLPEQALEQYFASLRLNPTDPEVYNKIGIAYGETGRMDQAAPFFQSALSLAPGNASYEFNLRRAEQLAQPAH